MQRKIDQGKTTPMMSGEVSLPEEEILSSPWIYKI
jgi:hypothetical protein